MTVLRYAFIALACWGALCAQAQEDTGLPYTVTFDGVADKDLVSVLSNASNTVAMRDRPPATALLLRHRVEKDVPRLVQTIKALGYYSARIGNEVDVSTTPARVTFHVSAGPIYTLASVTVEPSGAAFPEGVSIPSPNDIGLKTGAPAETKAIPAAQQQLIDALRHQGFPFARVADRTVVADHATNTASITFWLDTGPVATFGAVTFTGLDSVEESFPRKMIPWGEGDRYDGKLLDKYENHLAHTGLFALVKVTSGEALDAEGRLPIDIAVTERKQRSVAAGAGYSTDKGVGTRLSWEDRNVFHAGERLGFESTIAETEYSFEGIFRKPAFGRPDQTLQLKLRAAREDPDAYESRSVGAEALLERALSERLTLRGGMAVRDVHDRQFGVNEHFFLLSFPFQADWNGTDDPFDPAHGGRASLRMAPFFDLAQSEFDFLRTQVEYSHYIALNRSEKLILAGRARWGTMIGAGEGRIPADERFYAGGASSVRGYPYQAIGPQWRGDPAGGRSLVEMSTEMRYRLNKQL
ncbi:MAG: translocation and assembly module TamA, partial [Candidatus Hydrogenedentes bacterium]|nr:translocation and assembly module TamA [Candidatus Hydrogenedentota bacterium]